MELWIGNATRQIKDFCYRPLESTGYRTQSIPPGSQTKVSGRLTKEDVDFIIEQHVPYGLIPEDEIDHAPTFAGLCYSVDKPVTRTRLIYLFDHNLGHLEQMGRDIREASAVAQNVQMQTTLVEQGRAERLRMLDVTIQQENHDPGDTVPQFSVGLKVPGAAEPLRPTTGRKRRAA